MKPKIERNKICRRRKEFHSNPLSQESSYILMVYNTVFEFLQTWFQALENWLAFYQSLPEWEDRAALIIATREMMEGFLEALQALETEPLNNLASISEEKSND